MFKFHTVSHPSEVLKELYLDEIKITTTELAKKMGVSRSHMSEFLSGRVDISPEFALRLSKAFNTTPGLWINLQSKYDLWELEQNQAKVEELLKNVQVVIPMIENFELA
jgi:antitoxin HigA-1